MRTSKIVDLSRKTAGIARDPKSSPKNVKFRILAGKVILAKTGGRMTRGWCGKPGTIDYPKNQGMFMSKYLQEISSLPLS
jgi:hypothetical protein